MRRRTSHTSPPDAQPRGGTESTSRTLYARAGDPEGSFPAGGFVQEIRAELRRLAGPHDGTPRLDDLVEQAATWAGQDRERYRSLMERASSGPPGAGDVLVRRAALGCAPLGLASGAWLQWLSSPGNADDAVVLDILTLYASDVGVGHPRASRGSAYLVLLRHLLLSENAVPRARLALERRIADGAFYLPALLLGMSRRPDDFRPEILGADLCLRSAGLPPALSLVRQAHPAATDWTAIDPGTVRQAGWRSGAEQSRVAVEALLDAAPGGRGDVSRPAGGDAERVALGFGWALAALRRWSDDLHAELDASLDPAYEMAELLRIRSREGSVYHHDFTLQDRSLSEWLKQSRTDPGPLLEALAGSRLVKPGRSSASSLVNGLVGERGPMFRVFGPEDLSVIRRWIDALPAGGDGPAAVPLPAVPGRDPLVLPSLHAAPPEQGRTPSGLREAYHLLQRRTDTPALRRFALTYVHRWLARSRHGIDNGELQLPERWSPEGLRPWLAEQHDRHGREFEENADVPVPSREELIDSTLQLAPLTLIDGSWLQGFTDYEHASSEIGHSLFETYWDELGNGEVKLNHPLIYRQVLAEMGIELPPTGTPEFARWPGLREGSFELPVYWLSIGRFPQTFMPEVLGLNLAMELSGVGGTYRRARIALRKHGFSTRFVDIHNTIDNVASGHSAWAADAVDTYMAALPSSRGTGAQARAWGRVRAGYRSLNPPRGFWARQAARRARAPRDPR
ncbi:iron-containing redox enzyme family protein [Streptosporangium longisporum]|uniref:IopB n=1 Tax=Streptosporangium longisporum TaxID=46187 RepID=A0ABN3Y3F3_9ACTN